MTYYCKCCDYRTDKKDSFTKHLNSKKHATMGTSSYDLIVLLDKMSKRIEVLENGHNDLKKENEELRAIVRNGPTNSNINSNINSNNITININIDRNTFENENLEALDGQVKRLIKNKDGAIADIVRQLHFNEKHPENRNIKAEAIKSGMVGVHGATKNGKEWIRKPKKQALEDIAINATQQFKDKAEEQELSIVMEDTLKKMTEPIIDNQHCDHKRKLKTECKNIEALLQTERKAGRDPKD